VKHGGDYSAEADDEDSDRLEYQADEASHASGSC
jgi:hypothetical protein